MSCFKNVSKLKCAVIKVGMLCRQENYLSILWRITMARTKKVRFNEEPNLSEAIYRFDPSLTYISLHSNHAVKMDQIRKSVRRQNAGTFDVDANIKAAYKQVGKRSPEKATAHTQVYNPPQKKKTAHTQAYNHPKEKQTAYIPQDSDYPIYYGLLPSEIHPIAVAQAPERPKTIRPVAAPMPSKTAATAPERPKTIRPVAAPMPSKAGVTAPERPKTIRPVAAPMPSKTAAAAPERPKTIRPVAAPMPSKTAAAGPTALKTTVTPQESGSKKALPVSMPRRHTSSSPREKASAFFKDFTGRFDGISLNLNTIALATSVLAAVLFLFIGYVSISVFRDRNASGKDLRAAAESSVSSSEEELPEYCPRLTLITHSVTMKAGDHFSPLDYIGTMSDDTDTLETLSQNIMLIGFDQLDETKKGTYKLGYYVLDSDDNRSNVEYLDITVH